MSVEVSYRKQIVFGIFMLIFFLGIIEISIRVFELNFSDINDEINEIYEKYDEEVIEKLFSNGAFVYKYDKILLNGPNQKLNTININEHGFRGQEISLEKESDTYRIFLVGGSTMIGLDSSSDDTTIPGYLQQFFDDSKIEKNIEIINAGIPNADSRSEIFLVKNHLLKFEPDLIFVYDGINDAHHDWGWNNEVEDQSILANLENSFEIGIRSFYQSKIEPYYHTISFIHNIIKNENDDNKSNQNIDVPDKTLISLKTQKWIQRWSSICELGNEEGFKTIISVQPVLGTGKKILTADEMNRLNNSIKKQEVVFQLLEEYSKALEILEKKCYKTIDLRNSFDGISEPIYSDLGHMGDFGNKIIAKEIFEKIKQIFNER